MPATLSSEFPVNRGNFIEILVHKPDSIDLSRTPIPLIENHDSSRLNIGIIENLSVSGGKLRGLVRFGESARADEVFRDVVSGIIQNMSIAYEWLDYREEADKVFVTKWMPYECSAVSVPADPNAGFFRGISKVNTQTQNQESERLSRSERRAAVHDIETERTRCTRIARIGEQFGPHAEAARYIANGGGVDEFQDRILALRESTVAKPLSDAWEGHGTREAGGVQLNAREAAQYSILRGIRTLLDPRQGNCFEFELSHDLDRQLGRKSRGFSVPLTGLPWRTRAMSVGSDAGGGFMVGETLMNGDMIEALRASSVVMLAGARSLDGLVGDVLIPRLDSGPAAGWIGEAGNAPEADPAFGQVGLRPRTVAAYADLTRKLLQQTGRAAESLIRSEFVAALGTEMDRAALAGSGVSFEPLGVLNQSGINTATVASPGTPTWAEIVDFEGKVETDNALTGNLAYVVHPGTKAKMKATQKASGTGFIWENGRVGDHAGYSTANLPEHGILFGNFSDLIIGTWGVLDIVVDTASLSKSGGARICAFLDVDIAVRHAVSFCKNA